MSASDARSSAQLTLSLPTAPVSAAAAGRVAAGSSFYWAMRILPAAQREAMFQIYAFCRAVDDIADGPGSREERSGALEAWRCALRACYAGSPPQELASLDTEIRAFDLREDDFGAVIDGMQMDVDADMRAPDWATLDLFCDRVASAVGRLCVRVFGVAGERGIGLAHHLGRGLQLTNILRDLDEDAGVGRLYLPREALVRAGIASDDPGVVLANAGLDRACSEVAQVAEKHLRESARLMAGAERAATRAPRIMAAAYENILAALRRRGFAAPRTRVRLARWRLVVMAVRYGIV